MGHYYKYNELSNKRQSENIKNWYYECVKWELLQKLKWVDGLLVLGLILIAIGVGINVKDEYFKETKVEVVSAGRVDTQVSNKVMIDIAGEVVNPGVYEFQQGDRIQEALVKAGGLSVGADREWVGKNLNKAKALMDGQKIYIPREQEDYGEVMGETSKIISLNNASLSDLDRLRGVGPSLAQKIIDYREKNGGFKNKEELKMVSGIGEKLYEGIKDQIDL